MSMSIDMSLYTALKDIFPFGKMSFKKVSNKLVKQIDCLKGKGF